MGEKQTSLPPEISFAEMCFVLKSGLSAHCTTCTSDAELLR